MAHNHINDFLAGNKGKSREIYRGKIGISAGTGYLVQSPPIKIGDSGWDFSASRGGWVAGFGRNVLLIH